MKRYLPIRIHSISMGNGYWWGKRIFFRGCYILPMFRHYPDCQTPDGEAIRPKWPESWHRTNDKYRK